MSRIIVESGIDKGLQFEIPEGRTTLGRSAANVIQIIDKRMSRHHIEFLRRTNTLTLIDLGSKNGTYLNNQRVVGEMELKNQDRIRIGETVLLVLRDDPTSSRSGTGGVSFQESGWVDKAARSSTMMAGTPALDLQRQLAAATSNAAAESSAMPINAGASSHIEILFAVADAIRTILDLDELLERILDIIWESLDPDNGVLFLVDDQTNQLYPVSSRRAIREPGKPARWEAAQEDIAISSSIINRAMNDRVCVLMADAEDQRFGQSESIILNRINSALCCPLITKDEILGVVYIDSSSKFQAFTREQQALLTGIANQAAMAISNVKLHKRLVDQQKLEREMEIARTIQMNLLPKQMPELRHFEIAAMSLAAKQVGGDYYDFVHCGDNRYGLAIADVSGKGVPAALLTTTVRASMLAIAEDKTLTPPELMKRLNAVTYRDSLNNMFVTMVYAIVDDECRSVEFTNAGHAHPLIFRPDGSEVPLIQGGCFLGIEEQMDYDQGTEVMVPGSVMVLYTDGVTDSTNEENQQFGTERFRAVVREHMAESAQDIVDAIYQSTLAFRGTAPQFDDFTLIVCKCIS